MEQRGDNERDNRAAWEGRDEMNLAEFPIACLSSRPSKTLKTLQFEDRIWDRGRGARLVRRLTISASDKYGLPTALDDEVILGLIQLSREDDFTTRRVFFSRYRLIRLLGWRNEGKSYTRLETSLKRWIGVTFYYENAWWDNAKQAWVDESFHLLDRVSLLARGRGTARATVTEPALSMFCWNEVVFRSFQCGYLKGIDLALFRRLESPVAKRLYRLLDKRFYHKARWRFDLRELACEHVGLSRTYDTAGLKRKLLPAIAELETVGYLKPAPAEKRFIRLARGQWEVEFQRERKPREPSKPADRDGDGDIERLLAARGVNPRTAARLAAEHPTDEIRGHVAALDWLLANDRDRSPRNPAGFLVQSIREGYAIPDSAGAKGQASSANTSRSGGKRHCRRRQRTSEPYARRDEIQDYLKQLDPDRRRRLEAEALASAAPLLADRYEQARSAGSRPLAEIYRYLIIERHLAGRGKLAGPDPKRRK